MLRVGVDMLEVARVERAISRHGERFFERFFTPAERDYCGGAYHRLAARIAAKEAVAKALGTGIGDVKWVEIEVLADERRRPVLHLHGRARALADEMNLRNWDISLSHTEEQAIAFVVAMG
ncbi:MAG: holo-ACP synthase [Chloroflexi bacterium]|nr:holo-ACP synthase [Chloroflexota bacterium]